MSDHPDASAELRLAQARARALAFLSRRQLPNGQFDMRIGGRLRSAVDGVSDPCTFATAVIVYSLGFSGTVEASEIIARALPFLQAELLPCGVWKYWTAEHPGSHAMPPDVDDTACISHTLRRHGLEVPDNRRLLAANRDRRGRFYTWLAPRLAPPPLNVDYWRVVLRQLRTRRRSRAFWTNNDLSPKDVASVVNANVLLYLGDCSATAGVSDYLHDVLRSDREADSDQWYRSRFAFYYAVSRCAYAGIRSVEPLIDRIVERVLAAASADGSIGADALDTAQAVCALQNCSRSGTEIDAAVEFLLSGQSAEGGWPIAPFYFGGDMQFGSEEVATGFSLEALARYTAVGVERKYENGERAS